MLYQISFWNLDDDHVVYPVEGMQVGHRPNPEHDYKSEDQLKKSVVRHAQRTAKDYGDSMLSVYDDDGNLLELVEYSLYDGKMHSDCIRA